MLERLSAGLAVLFVGVALAQSGTAPVVRGVNPRNMDVSTSPREDFNRYANGGWLGRTEIPANEGRYSVLDEVHDRTVALQIKLLETLARPGELTEGSDAWKAVKMFEQGLDIRARNAQGVAPLQPLLKEIGAVDDLEGFHTYLESSLLSGVSGPFGVGVAPGFADSTRYTTYLGPQELGLPNRGFYLEKGERFEAVREAYVVNSAELLGYGRGEHVGRRKGCSRSRPRSQGPRLHERSSRTSATATHR